MVQFSLSLAGGPSSRDLAWAKAQLSACEWRLFACMSPVEQAHAVRVAKRARALAAQTRIPTGERRALIKAALLHDVGKSGAVGLLDKVAIVLLTRFTPTIAHSLCEIGEEADGSGAPAWRKGMARAFYADRTHPERGADMAMTAGAEQTVVRLIRNHHAPERGNDLLGELLARADRNA